jgi:carbamoyltransferase
MRLENVRKLNDAIKMRDFWMPFAPSILWEARRDYCELPKDPMSFHMMIACDSTARARKELIAAVHPRDFTMRPHFVTKEHNPGYHRMISEFRKLTDVGGVLNTSFNLHGWPIVCSPRDALRTLLNSDLDYVTLNDRLVWKRGKVHGVQL